MQKSVGWSRNILMTYLIRKICFFICHGMVKMSGSEAILWKFGHFGFPYFINGCLWAEYMVQNEIIMGAFSLFFALAKSGSVDCHF